jgi:hypothetical protein
MLRHHDEVSRIFLDFGLKVNLHSEHHGLSSIYLTSANDLLVKILQVLLMQEFEKMELHGYLSSKKRITS